MGKYSKVLDGLKRFFGKEPHHQQRIEAVKTRIATSVGKKDPLDVEADLQVELNNLSKACSEIDQQGVYLLAPSRQGADYARAYRAVRLIKEELKARLSNVDLLLTAYEQMMVEQFEVEDVDLLKLGTGDKVNVQFEPYPKTTDAAAVNQWCIAQGYQSQMSLPWQTFHMLVKQRLLEGLPAPPGVELTSRPKIVFTKAKG
jgi:hypothetical protein